MNIQNSLIIYKSITNQIINNAMSISNIQIIQEYLKVQIILII